MFFAPVEKVGNNQDWDFQVVGLIAIRSTVDVLEASRLNVDGKQINDRKSDVAVFSLTHVTKRTVFGQTSSAL